MRALAWSWFSTSTARRSSADFTACVSVSPVVSSSPYK